MRHSSGISAAVIGSPTTSSPRVTSSGPQPSRVARSSVSARPSDTGRARASLVDDGRWKRWPHVEPSTSSIAYQGRPFVDAVLDDANDAGMAQPLEPLNLAAQAGQAGRTRQTHRLEAAGMPVAWRRAR